MRSCATVGRMTQATRTVPNGSQALVAFVAWTTFVFLGVGTIGERLWGPSPEDLSALCAAHEGVAQIAYKPLVREPVIVCRDGSVQRIKR